MRLRLYLAILLFHYGVVLTGHGWSFLIGHFWDAAAAQRIEERLRKCAHSVHLFLWNDFGGLRIAKNNETAFVLFHIFTGKKTESQRFLCVSPRLVSVLPVTHSRMVNNGENDPRNLPSSSRDKLYADIPNQFVAPQPQWSNNSYYQDQYHPNPQPISHQFPFQQPLAIMQPQSQLQQMANYSIDEHFYPTSDHQHLSSFEQPLHLEPPARKRKAPRKVETARRRRRHVTSCERCRFKKIKCNSNKPSCESCLKSKVTCTYRPSAADGEIEKEIAEAPKEDKKFIDVNSGFFKLVAPDADTLQKMGKWSSCEWFTPVESVFQWPVFREKYRVKPVHTVLGQYSNDGIPQVGLLKDSEIQELLQNFTKNLERYMTDFNENIQMKNPFINFHELNETVQFIKSALETDRNSSILDIKIPEDFVPLPLLMIISAGAVISKPLTYTNAEDYKTSLEEKSSSLELSYKYYVLASYLNQLPLYSIDEFNIHSVQFKLLQGNYWMYNMKPLKAWNYIFQSSTSVITIIELYKNSNIKFTERQHRTLERVFHTCVRYECELRVELSPNVPASGIVNYKFLKVYPTPPSNSSIQVKEELSWFYYLTEIILRRIENRILDEFYLLDPKISDPKQEQEDSNEKNHQEKNEYCLNWNKLELAHTVTRVEEYVKEISQIEQAIQGHIDGILRADEVSSYDISQPHGFAFQNLPSSTSNSEKIRASKISAEDQKTALPITPNPSLTSAYPSSISPTTILNQNLPEVLSFIRTRVITIRMLLYRPLVYIVVHSELDNAQLVSNPIIGEFLRQSSESTEFVNVPLAVHRHFGSWFYLRNVFLYVMIAVALYERFKKDFATKEKMEILLKNCIGMYDYWIDECPGLLEAKENLTKALENLGDA
jgi:hypothetical protein